MSPNKNYIEASLFSRPYFAFMALVVDELQLRSESFGDLFKKLYFYLSKIREDSSNQTFQVEATDAALFAVCAWADEQIMNSEWEGVSDRWSNTLLQKVFFDTSLAGSEFFDKMNNLSTRQMLAKDIYAYCLTCGFKGKYVYDLQTENLDFTKNEYIYETLVSDGLIDPSTQTFLSLDYLLKQSPRNFDDLKWLMKLSIPFFSLSFLVLIFYLSLESDISKLLK